MSVFDELDLSQYTTAKIHKTVLKMLQECCYRMSLKLGRRVTQSEAITLAIVALNRELEGTEDNVREV